jgi:hypothetical protein
LASFWRTVSPEKKKIYVAFSQQVDQAQTSARRRFSPNNDLPSLRISSFHVSLILVVRQRGSNLYVETASVTSLILPRAAAARIVQA